jgi:putative flippase GtrA
VRGLTRALFFGRHARPVRFAAVGAATFGLQLALLGVLSSAGLISVAAYAVALGLSVQFNFVVNQLLVWHDRPASLAPARLLHRWATFHAYIAISLVINLTAFIASEPFVSDLAAAVIALAASTVIKFVSLDRFVFRAAPRRP